MMAVNIVEKIDDLIKVQNVLISVSDKTGLNSFVSGLVGVNEKLSIFSTGGTHQAIAEILKEIKSSVRLIPVSDYTGQPEMQGGLVKTLDFKIYLGILSETYNEAHIEDMKRADAVNIDMVVVNLYPFKKVSSEPGSTIEHARANIDIGGPCMVRAAAKNFLRVASVTNPSDYGSVIEEIERSKGMLSLQTRFYLAQKAFAHTSEYDTAIARHMAQHSIEKVKKSYTIINATY